MSGHGLLGRHPESQNPSVVCTAVDDPERSLSKTHAEYGLDDQGLWFRDRGSTNGTDLVRKGAQPVRLVPGEPVSVSIGDALILGRRRVHVERAQES
ncbi:MAG: FHA domain-containing protein [Propionibacteriaceae bacterium]|nr:FHA domain-containing protein [Propionibacteriaceae bacterium]